MTSVRTAAVTSLRSVPRLLTRTARKEPYAGQRSFLTLQDESWNVAWGWTQAVCQRIETGQLIGSGLWIELSFLRTKAMKERFLDWNLVRAGPHAPTPALAVSDRPPVDGQP